MAWNLQSTHRYSLPGSYRSPRRPASEPLILVTAIVVLAISVVGYWHERTRARTIVPAAGGTFVEGMIGSDPTTIDQAVSHLTNVGLTMFDANGKVTPVLARSWSVSPDGKQYTFALSDSVTANGLIQIIKATKNGWDSLDMSAPDDHTLVFTLKQPFAQFLSSTTDPIFPFGPYRVTQQSNSEVDLRANNNFVLGAPHISKIVIKQFSSQAALSAALGHGEVDGVIDGANANDNFQSFHFTLPRYQMLFFNTTRPPFSNLAARRRVVEASDGPAVSYRLVTVDSSATSQLVKHLVDQLAKHHITVTIDKKMSITDLKTAITKHDFDLLVYGVDYGVDPDLYPFWHSSQVDPPGLNIAGIKSRALDDLVSGVRSTQDPAARADKVKAAEAYIQSNYLAETLAQDSHTYLVNRRVRGVVLPKAGDPADRFDLLYRWYINYSRK